LLVGGKTGQDAAAGNRDGRFAFYSCRQLPGATV